MMIAGPALVDWASQGDVSKEELGASKIHTRNGAIDDEAATEHEAFDMAKKFLSYMPENVDQLPTRHSCDDPQNRRGIFSCKLYKDPRKVYKMQSVVTVMDKGHF